MAGTRGLPAVRGGRWPVYRDGLLRGASALRTLRPLGALLLGLLTVQGGLWLGWGSPTPIYDEAGYLAAGTAGADAIRCLVSQAEGCSGLAAALGRVLWHNPGYSALFVLADLLPGDAASWIRGLQMVSGLLAAAFVHQALAARTSSAIALAAAAFVGLHPTHLFFRLTLWPVALGTALFAAAALLMLGLRDRPSRGGERALSGVLLALTLIHPLALGLLIVLPGWIRTNTPAASWIRILAPTLLVWTAVATASSIAVQSPALLVASPENAALGNNPWIDAHRGSSLHDRLSVQRLRAEVEGRCPDGLEPLHRLRCRAEHHRSIAGATIQANPTGALWRAVLRVLETWAPDDYTGRHLFDARVGAGTLMRSLAPPLVLLAELATLLLPVGLALGAARDRRVLAVASTVMACTAPVLLGVGLPRLRQPLLPILVVGAALTWARYHQRR